MIDESSRNTKDSQCFYVSRLWSRCCTMSLRNLLVRGSATDSNDVKISIIQLGVVRCSYIAVRDEH